MARLALLATCLLLLALAGLPGRAAAPAKAPTVEPVPVLERLPRTPRDDGLACKPRGPVQLQLQQLGAGAGGARSLAFALSPRESLDSLAWSLQLPDGGELLAGEPGGLADPSAHGVTAAQVQVRLPVDVEAAQVVLEARATWADGAEQVVVRRALTWGEAPPPVPEVELLDTLHGSSRRVAELPTSHQPGR